MDVNLDLFLKLKIPLHIFSLLCLLIIPGCGNESVPAPQSSLNPEGPAAAIGGNTGGSDSSPSLPQGVSADSSGKKQLDDIPYDIWFEKPLALVTAEDLKSPQPVTAQSPELGTPSPQPTPSTPSTNTSSVSSDEGSAGEWDRLITAAILEAEVTRISITLNSYLNQLAQFNSSANEIIQESETLIAASLVASQRGRDTLEKPGVDSGGLCFTSGEAG
ncbi:MAG: hypothetical protein R3C11_06165 [Planctomycetaceae bacterium]